MDAPYSIIDTLTASTDDYGARLLASYGGTLSQQDLSRLIPALLSGGKRKTLLALVPRLDGTALRVAYEADLDDLGSASLLSCAAFLGWRDLTEALLDRGADPHGVVLQNDGDISHLSVDIPCSTALGIHSTPLSLALYQGDFELADLLLARMEDPAPSLSSAAAILTRWELPGEISFPRPYRGETMPRWWGRRNLADAFRLLRHMPWDKVPLDFFFFCRTPRLLQRCLRSRPPLTAQEGSTGLYALAAANRVSLEWGLFQRVRPCMELLLRCVPDLLSTPVSRGRWLAAALLSGQDGLLQAIPKGARVDATLLCSLLTATTHDVTIDPDDPSLALSRGLLQDQKRWRGLLASLRRAAGQFSLFCRMASLGESMPPGLGRELLAMELIPPRREALTALHQAILDAGDIRLLRRAIRQGLFPSPLLPACLAALAPASPLRSLLLSQSEELEEPYAL